MPPTRSFPCPFCDLPSLDDSTATCPGCARAPSVSVGGRSYRIDRLLGKGGMGTIYGANGDGAGPPVDRVVVKLVKPERDETIGELFERSSRVLAGLSHPSLPSVRGVTRDEETGRLFLVREPFDGGTLAERITRDARHLEPGQVMRLAESLLRLAAYLHNLVPPVIHRDIKPSNVMFRGASDWDPVLVDFDTVAKPMEQRSGITIVGTVGYAAPEQLGGDVSPASDLYAVGATLLFVITHVEPADLPRDKGRLKLDDQPALSRIDARLRKVLLRLVEPDVHQRYARAEEALADLAAAPPSTVSEPRNLPAPAWPVQRPTERVQPRGVIGTISGVLVALLLASVATGVLVYRAGHRRHHTYYTPPPPPPPPRVNSCGSPRSCYDVAERELKGQGRPKDLDGALRHFGAACDGGYWAGCTYLGWLHYEGKELTPDLPRAVALFEKACTNGNALGCTDLGNAYYKGRGKPLDHDQAYRYYRLGCDGADLIGCNGVGWLIEYGEGTTADPKRAVEIYRSACDRGHLPACDNLGYALTRGVGARRDDVQAMQLFVRGCVGGDGLSCNNQGWMYDDARGVPRDIPRAIGLYLRACLDGAEKGCTNLREKYAPATRALAVAELRRSCAENKTFSCDQLRTLHETR